MNATEIILLTLAIVAALYGYVHYGREIPRQTLRPRPFTWLIWGVLSTCVTIIQLENGAGLGVIGALLGAVSGYVLAGMAWYYGHRKVYGTDIISLLLAFAVLIAWAFVGDRVTVVAATIVYLIGFVPTAIRAYHAPHKERQAPFAMSVVKYTISLMLLSTVSISTAIYPLALVLANFAFLVMLWVRRRRHSSRQHRRKQRK